MVMLICALMAHVKEPKMGNLYMIVYDDYIKKKKKAYHHMSEIIL